jgi:hypothetical protein
MSHREQMDFVSSLKNNFPNFFINSNVLVIGSLNINGTIRVFFENCKYIGVDVGSGIGVDFIEEGQKLNFDSNSFDTVASCECFEHNIFWAETFLNMYRMTKENSLLFFTCATTGRSEHGTRRTTPQDAPLLKWDYYKNLTELDFRKIFNFENMFNKFEFKVNNASKDLYFYGIKK